MTHIADLLEGAKALVSCMRIAICEEYEWDEADYPNGAVLILEGKGAVAGGKNTAWMHGDSMGALARKPLCAMMTKDHFFVTLGGHSAAAGHGERREPTCPELIETTIEFDRQTNAKKLRRPLPRRHGTE